MRGHLPAALVPLERALRLAEPEEYIGTFVDEGRPMAALLQTAVKHGIALGYVSRLVARFRASGGPERPPNRFVSRSSHSVNARARRASAARNGPGWSGNSPRAPGRAVPRGPAPPTRAVHRSVL